MIRLLTMVWISNVCSLSFIFQSEMPSSKSSLIYNIIHHEFIFSCYLSSPAYKTRCPPFLSIWEFESCYLSSLVTIFPGTESVRGLFHLILGEVVCRFTLTIRHNITFISSIARELMCLNILINVEGTLIWIIIISAWIHQQMEKMHLLACFDV